MRAIKKLKLPSAYTILFCIIAFMAVMTWIIPAGEYLKEMNPALGKEVAVEGTYHTTKSDPQGIIDVLQAPMIGIEKSIDIGLFILMIGSFLMVVTATGAINAGIARAVKRLKGREYLLIPTLMSCFAAGGTIFGMAEETIAFYMLILPVVIAAGYDALTGVAIILLGSGVGVLGSVINPFSTVIASDASGIPFTQGMGLRIVILLISFVISVLFVMRYAKKVKTNPRASIIAELKEDNEKYFLEKEGGQEDEGEFLFKHKLILSIFFATFGIMIWGVSLEGWWMTEMATLFLGASILVAIVGGLSEKEFIHSFIQGSKDLLGVALILGVARGIGIVMDNGMITGTILHWGESGLTDLPSILFINVMYLVHIVLSIFIPSTSGLAVFSMPIMAPLADFAGVGRDLAVTAYQTSAGLTNLVTPTYGVVVAGLAMGRISIVQWFRFMWPLLLILAAVSMTALSLGVFWEQHSGQMISAIGHLIK
ncbi:MAG: YfcC family protein [Endozoicomonas sp. (ex Botrylloides leachii)]|nr:YfcC family protein [Endozoicomonas sp. (ex Botrylloides leachii)]